LEKSLPGTKLVLQSVIELHCMICNTHSQGTTGGVLGVNSYLRMCTPYMLLTVPGKY